MFVTEYCEQASATSRSNKLLKDNLQWVVPATDHSMLVFQDPLEFLDLGPVSPRVSHKASYQFGSQPYRELLGTARCPSDTPPEGDLGKVCVRGDSPCCSIHPGVPGLDRRSRVLP